MRIAHVGVEIVPSDHGAFVGGLVKNVATLGSAQVRRGHDVHVFTTDVRGRHASTQSSPYGRVHVVRTAGEYGSLGFAISFLTGAQREIRRVHDESPFDLVHVHSAYASLGIVARPLRKLRVPLVFSLYSPNFRARPGHDCNGSRAWLAHRLAARSLRSFDATIVPSENLRTKVAALGIHPDSISRVPPALDPSMLEPLPSRADARRLLNLPADSPIVLFLGNYSPWKGVENLLRAISSVKALLPDVLLLTAWGEPYEWEGNRRGAVLRLVDELGLAGSVRQIGIVPDVRLLLRAANLLASPFECTCKVLDYPLSLLEAMACELPVISTTVGGIPEVLDRGGRGITVPPRDSKRLADAISMLLLDDRLAQTIGSRGARWARDEFRTGLAVDSVESVYQGLFAEDSVHDPPESPGVA